MYRLAPAFPKVALTISSNNNGINHENTKT
jgi:hypothetical protein